MKVVRRPAPPPHRSTVPAALLLLTLVLAGLVAWESWDAARTERRATERVLRGYASLATSQLLDAVRESLDERLGDLFAPVVGGRAVSPFEPLPPPEALVARVGGLLACPDARAGRTTTFRLDFVGGALATAGDPAGDATREWITRALPAHARASFTPERRWAVMTGTAGGRTQAVVYAIKYAQYAAPVAAYGFVTCPAAFGAPLVRTVLASRSATPGAAAMPDSLLDVVVRDPEGRVLAGAVTAGGAAAGSGAAGGAAILEGPHHEEAREEFPGLVLGVALRPDALSWLALRTERSSRLPLLIALLAASGMLAGIGVWQVRRAEELARLRTDFTSSVSHELRTPLAQILLYGETLALDRMRTADERRHAAETIVAEARRLMHLVSNVLHFAGAERGITELALRPVALAPLVRSVITGFAPLAASRGARVTAALDDVHAAVDDAALRQVVLNLLDNAVKYGPNEQEIHVTVRRAGAKAVLRVDDAGPGIPATDRERVFDAYVRLTRDHVALGASHGGSGLGLAVVRDLVKRMRGTVRLDDSAAGGTAAVVELPAADPEPGEPPAGRRASGARGGAVPQEVG